MVKVGEIIVEIIGRDKLSGTLKVTSLRLKAFRGGLKTTSKVLKGVFRAATKIAIAGIVGIGVALAVSVKAAADFETALIGVGKTTGLSGDALKDLGEEFKDLSSRIPVATNELLGIGQAAAQLGVQGAENILRFTETIAKLSVATDLTSEQAAFAFARIANVMDIPIEKIEEMGTVVVRLGNEFPATESEITTFATRLAGTGKVVGLSFDQVAALSTALASVGVNAEAGGTAFSRLLIEMAAATSGTSKNLSGLEQEMNNLNKEMGNLNQAFETGTISLDEFDVESNKVQKLIDKLNTKIKKVGGKGGSLEKFAKVAGVTGKEFKETFEKDATEALDLFIRGLSEMNDVGGDVFGTLEDLGLSDRRLRDAILRLSGAGDVLTRALATANDEMQTQNALAEESAAAFDSFNSTLQILKNVINNSLLIPLGDALIPILKDIADWFVDNKDVIRSWVEDNVERLKTSLDEVDWDEFKIAAKDAWDTMFTAAEKFINFVTSKDGLQKITDTLTTITKLLDTIAKHPSLLLGIPFAFGFAKALAGGLAGSLLGGKLAAGRLAAGGAAAGGIGALGLAGAVAGTAFIPGSGGPQELQDIALFGGKLIPETQEALDELRNEFREGNITIEEYTRKFQELIALNVKLISRGTKPLTEAQKLLAGQLGISIDASGRLIESMAIETIGAKELTSANLVLAASIRSVNSARAGSRIAPTPTTFEGAAAVFGGGASAAFLALLAQADFGLARGGIVTRPSLRLLGEAGPEAVIPLNRAGGLGGTINIFVEGTIVSETELADNVAEVLQDRLNVRQKAF